MKMYESTDTDLISKYPKASASAKRDSDSMTTNDPSLLQTDIAFFHKPDSFRRQAVLQMLRATLTQSNLPLRCALKIYLTWANLSSDYMFDETTSSGREVQGGLHLELRYSEHLAKLSWYYGETLQWEG